MTLAALLSSRCPSPRSLHPLFNRTHQRYGECTSPGVPSPTALDSSGCPYAAGAPTSRHHPSSGFSTLSTSCFTQNHAGFLSAHGHRSFDRRLMHARCAPGVPPDLRRSPGIFRSPAGRRRPGSLFKALSSPTTNPFWRALLSRASEIPEAIPVQGNHMGASGRRRVSIVEESVYPKGATSGHRPS